MCEGRPARTRPPQVCVGHHLLPVQSPTLEAACREHVKQDRKERAGDEEGEVRGPGRSPHARPASASFEALGAEAKGTELPSGGEKQASVCFLCVCGGGGDIKQGAGWGRLLFCRGCQDGGCVWGEAGGGSKEVS